MHVINTQRKTSKIIKPIQTTITSSKHNPWKQTVQNEIINKTGNTQLNPQLTEITQNKKAQYVKQIRNNNQQAQRT